MRKIKPLILVLIVAVLIYAVGMYVYIGTYFLPIAPHWITQLPPNPPKPKIKYGEFDFNMTYSFKGVMKEISDTIVCKFEGFEVPSVGETKERVWTENLKNTGSYELFHFRDEERNIENKTYSSICIENIDNYKVVLNLPKAEWFLGEPNCNYTPDMPDIQVYDTKTRYYLIPEQKDEVLKKFSFEVIEWTCDKPIKNKFE